MATAVVALIFIEFRVTSTQGKSNRIELAEDKELECSNQMVSMLHMKRGFTLVELSIVLVIIGLLVGGILVAQSMIQTTKIQSGVRQIQQFDVAMQNFQTKYNALPGDARVFGGDGDGRIGDETDNATVLTGESPNFWPNMQASGFDPSGKVYSSTFTGIYGSTGTVNGPVMKFNDKIGVAVYSCGTTAVHNCYNMADWSAVITEVAEASPKVRVVDLIAIDQKIDDGKPAAGSMQNRLGQYEGVANSLVCSDYDGTNENTAKYLLTNPNTVCWIAASVGGAPLDKPFESP